MGSHAMGFSSSEKSDLTYTKEPTELEFIVAKNEWLSVHEGVNGNVKSAMEAISRPRIYPADV